MAANPILSLLEKITSRQIEDLIFEEQLLQKDYTLYYALDNHDIHKYCFPGNLTGTEFERNSDGNINYELETDRITAHEEFFSKIGEGSYCFFLDEYISEFIGLRDEILRILEHGQLLNYADSFQTFLTKYASSNAGIRADFTLYISVATGLLRNGARRFNGLLSNPYFFVKPDDLDRADIKHAAMIKQAFSHSLDQDSQLTDHIYNAFAHRSTKAMRLSKKIDSEAISRMIRLNEYLLQHFREDKVLFLFLSSTDSTRDIFNTLDQERRLPMVEEASFNFHRTVEQLFISRLLNDLPVNERLERLETAKELITYRERAQQINIDRDEYVELEGRAMNSFHRLREKYVNFNLARLEQFQTTKILHEKLEERFSSSTDRGIQTRQLKKMYNELKAVSEKYGANDTNRGIIQKLESALRIGDIFSYVFKKAVSELQNDKPILISRGKDPIKGAGQHLPIVFRCHVQPHARNLDDIAELYLDQLALVDKTNIRHKDAILARLQALTSTIYEHNVDGRSLGEKLVFCLYLLVLPDAGVSREKSNNDMVVEFLTDLFAQELHPEDKLLYSDFLYTSCWVFRRHGQYRVALNFANEGLERYPEDARFYHARFLVNACMQPHDHALHLADILLAKEKYDMVLEGKSELIRRNIISAILNSEIFASTLLLIEKKAPPTEKLQALHELRTDRLEQLKAVAGSAYEDYPEFLHTEAFLELQEFDNMIDKEQKEQKIDYAILAIRKGIERAKTLVGFDLEIFNNLYDQLWERKQALQNHSKIQ